MLDLKKLFATFKSSFPYEKTKGEELTDYIAERYEEVRATIKRLAEIEKEKVALKEQLERDLFSLNSERIHIQDNCPHPLVTEEFNDFDGSFKTCDICGVRC